VAGRTTENRAALLQDELARFTREIVPRMKPRQILLFGSLATGKIHEWSDLDLVIVADTSLPFLDRVKEVMTLFHPRVGMDVLVYTPEEWDTLIRERPFIREEIVEKGKVIYERPSDPVA